MKPTANQIICSNNIDVVKPWPANCIDGICTDPPYGLGFMGKKWDTLIEKTRDSAGGFLRNGKSGSNPYAAARCRHGSDSIQMQEWYYQWAKAMLRITKPGGFLLCFGGTRTFHRLACAIEDAGWEIRDCMMWLYGSGFPKSHDISKAIEKAKGVKPIGKKPAYGAIASRELIDERGWNNINNALIMPETQTDLAQLWSGYGTALKPSFEPILLCQKPLTVVPFYGIIKETQNLLGALLCQSLLNVNSVEKISKSSPNVSGEVSASALMLAALLRGNESDVLSDMTDMFNSPEMVSMCLNTVKLWSNILTAVYSQASTFTTETVIGLTTGLKILNSLLSKNIPAEVIRVVSLLAGARSFVKTVEKSLSGEEKNLKNTQRLFAPVLVSVQQSKNGTNAKNVERNLQLIIQNVNSVLLNVLQSIIVEKDIKLSPNWEPIIVAMKPLDGTFANNAERHGVAGLNINAARIGTEKRFNQKAGNPTDKDTAAFHAIPNPHNYKGQECQGRWPANLILDEEAGAMLDEQTGNLKSGAIKSGARAGSTFSIGGEIGKRKHKYSMESTSGGASRFFYCAKASRKERNMGLEDQSGKKVNDGRQTPIDNPYQRGETVRCNTHPTVKPLALMKYLCTLLKMPSASQIILDPFLGSGTTGMACASLGIGFIGIEKELEYCEISAKRITAISGKLLSVTKNVEPNKTLKNPVDVNQPPSPAEVQKQKIINVAVAALKNRKNP